MTSITDILAMELKPCPYCGDEADPQVPCFYDGYWFARIKCDPCHVTSYLEVCDSDKATALSKLADAWNTRAPTQDAILGKKLAEALEQAIRRVELYHATHGEISDCVTPADLGDWINDLAEWNKLEGAI